MPNVFHVLRFSAYIFQHFLSGEIYFPKFNMVASINGWIYCFQNSSLYDYVLPCFCLMISKFHNSDIPYSSKYHRRLVPSLFDIYFGHVIHTVTHFPCDHMISCKGTYEAIWCQVTAFSNGFAMSHQRACF